MNIVLVSQLLGLDLLVLNFFCCTKWSKILFPIHVSLRRTKGAFFAFWAIFFGLLKHQKILSFCIIAHCAPSAYLFSLVFTPLTCFDLFWSVWSVLTHFDLIDPFFTLVPRFHSFNRFHPFSPAFTHFHPFSPAFTCFDPFSPALTHVGSFSTGFNLFHPLKL